MNNLLIELLQLFEEEEIDFVLSKSAFRPKEFGRISTRFSNGWSISVATDDGYFNMRVSKDDYDVYHNYTDKEEVSKLILDVKNYDE